MHLCRHVHYCQQRRCWRSDTGLVSNCILRSVVAWVLSGECACRSMLSPCFCGVPVHVLVGLLLCTDRPYRLADGTTAVFSWAKMKRGWCWRAHHVQFWKKRLPNRFFRQGRHGRVGNRGRKKRQPEDRTLCRVKTQKQAYRTTEIYSSRRQKPCSPARRQ